MFYAWLCLLDEEEGIIVTPIFKKKVVVIAQVIEHVSAYLTHVARKLMEKMIRDKINDNLLYDNLLSGFHLG